MARSKRSKLADEVLARSDVGVYAWGFSYNRRSPISWAIKFFSWIISLFDGKPMKQEWSHTFLVVTKDGHIFESYTGGIKIRHISVYENKKKYNMRLYYPVIPVASKDHVREQIKVYEGERYAFAQILFIPIVRFIRSIFRKQVENLFGASRDCKENCDETCNLLILSKIDENSTVDELENSLVTSGSVAIASEYKK